MIDIVKIFAALALGYLLGSFNTAVITRRQNPATARRTSRAMPQQERRADQYVAGAREVRRDTECFAGDILKGVIAVSDRVAALAFTFMQEKRAIASSAFWSKPAPAR